MVVRKRRKVTKYRGRTTHGGGSRKKRRGAGSRGGRGKAGSGKRAGHKKYGKTLGRVGFTSLKASLGKVFEEKVINVQFFSADNVNKLVSEGRASREKDYYSVDLEKLGYDKLLGAGNTTLRLKVIVPSCSSQAAEKIRAMGGEVIISGDASDEGDVSGEESRKNSAEEELKEN
ncbi:MAG: uL15m family ribosomal protein [Nanoarchaeota archaeon]